MRTAHQQTQPNFSSASPQDVKHIPETIMKKVAYWMFVFLVFVSLTALGMLALNWSINNRLF